MTAEVAIMNREAIALAADSAVTFREEIGPKIFTSASKIFTLSKYQPVGVMIYGNASHMGIPWETIIKIYRNTLGQKTFRTIVDYANNFLAFLAKEIQLGSSEEENRYVEISIYSYFQLISDEIAENVDKVIEEKGAIDETTTEKITSQIVNEHFERWRDTKSLTSIPKHFTRDFRQKYGNLIGAAPQEIFEKLPLTEKSLNQLTEIAVNLFMKFPTGLSAPGTSGVVIAGFGTDEVFPVLESFSIEGRIGKYLKHKRNEDKCVELIYPTNAAIRAFAQSEMVSTFMTGVDPNYQSAIDIDMRQICIAYPEVLVDNIDGLKDQEKEYLKNHLAEIGQKVFDKCRKQLRDYRKEHYVNPVMSVVQLLPKDELAAMAESLINLTSFKRRVSMEEETVGGPIDVAVISKGDGFIWIKRKHYFDRELNQQFFANYYKESDSHGGETNEKAD